MCTLYNRRVEKEMDEGLNPLYEVKPCGWKISTIPNPDYPRKSLEEYIQVAEWWNEEFIETWYWLIYQGKDPEGYQSPNNISEYEWEPGYNCWREANNEEFKIIQNYIREGKYIDLRRIKKGKFKVKSEERIRQKAKYIELPISFILKLDNGWIVKKWRANDEES